MASIDNWQQEQKHHWSRGGRLLKRNSIQLSTATHIYVETRNKKERPKNENQRKTKQKFVFLFKRTNKQETDAPLEWGEAVDNWGHVRRGNCFVQLSSAGSETPKVVAKTRSKAGRNEDALCRIIAVVGTGTPTQELESKRENQVGSEDATPPHTEKIKPNKPRPNQSRKATQM